MKLRIKGNSIRIRLLRSEVEIFAKVGRISDQASFGASALRYSVVMSKDAETIFATFSGSELAVSIPERSARDWTRSEQVGFETEQAIGDNETLTILIEKDFVCLDRPDDPDREQAYPNPNAVC